MQPIIRSIGEIASSNAGNIAFSRNGNKMAFTNLKGLIEVFDFDRCSAALSNAQVIAQETSLFLGGISGTAFSPSSSLLYIACRYQGSNLDTSYLYQYNLLDSNFTKDTLYTFLKPSVVGKLLLSENNRMYLSCAYEVPGIFTYPYPDSVRNSTNENLSVINSPDSLGHQCDFQPFSFYLGGKRTYYGLPSNPNYDLPALGGSICDTLGLPNIVNNGPSTIDKKLNVFYYPSWQTAFINASGLQGKNYSLHLVSLEGKEIVFETGVLSSGYFTKNLSCNNLSAGVYLVLLETERERLVKKFTAP
jgi:hypothetical protein